MIDYWLIDRLFDLLFFCCYFSADYYLLSLTFAGRLFRGRITECVRPYRLPMSNLLSAAALACAWQSVMFVRCICWHVEFNSGGCHFFGNPGKVGKFKDGRGNVGRKQKFGEESGKNWCISFFAEYLDLSCKYECENFIRGQFTSVVCGKKFRLWHIFQCGKICLEKSGGDFFSVREVAMLLTMV